MGLGINSGGKEARSRPFDPALIRGWVKGMCLSVYLLLSWEAGTRNASKPEAPCCKEQNHIGAQMEVGESSLLSRAVSKDRES